jgi:hypothetical protein
METCSWTFQSWRCGYYSTERFTMFLLHEELNLAAKRWLNPEPITTWNCWFWELSPHQVVKPSTLCGSVNAGYLICCNWTSEQAKHFHKWRWAFRFSKSPHYFFCTLISIRYPDGTCQISWLKNSSGHARQIVPWKLVQAYVPDQQGPFDALSSKFSSYKSQVWVM